MLRNHDHIAINLCTSACQAFLPAWILRTPEQLAHAFDELAEFARPQPGQRCRAHGDSHRGNNFLRANGELGWLDWQPARPGPAWRDFVYLMLGVLTIEERRAKVTHLLRHYRAALIATGARDVPGMDTAYAHFCRWPIHGMQACLGNVDAWGPGGMHIVERFFAAAGDMGTLASLTACHSPAARSRARWPM